MQKVLVIFLGIISLAGFGVYWGMGNSTTNDNFTNFVGSVELSGNSGLENYENQAKNQWSQKVVEKKMPKKNLETPVKNQETIISVKTAATATIPVSTSSIIAVFVSSTQNQTLPIQASLPAPSSSLAQNNQESGQRIIISEIMVGSETSADYEFIELYNPALNIIDLTGWSIKKRNSKNNEETLVSVKKFKDKKIRPNGYLLLANEGGYNGNIPADIFWPKSYSLAYKNNEVILYDAGGKAVEDIGWDEIAKGRSLERVLQNWTSGEFKIQLNPNPQNSQQ